MDQDGGQATASHQDRQTLVRNVVELVATVAFWLVARDDRRQRARDRGRRAVSGDGFGAVPAPDDGNPATVEQPGWRPLVAWGGLHYRPSNLAGVALGTKVATYDLQHAFGPAA